MTEYLREKLDRTNHNNPKANTGCAILKEHNEDVPDLDLMVMLAVQTLQMFFIRHSSQSPAGTSPLTNTSYTIGTKVARWINTELPWYKYVRLGDLFIEGLYNVGLIDLHYTQTRDGKHIILATNEWTKLKDIPEARKRAAIIGTSIDKPGPITKMMQTWKYIDNSDMQEPVIKEKGADHNHLIEENKGKTWLQSITKLQQVGWRVDKRILEAVITDGGPTPPEDEDDKQLMQRYNSKVIEREFIIAKAEELAPHDTFYQYISADYRGRLYYVEPFFNFQGSDWARGMLKFSRGKPMTAEGEQWLAIHTANSYNKSWNKDEIPDIFEEDYVSYLEDQKLESISLDKMSLNDRIIWVNAVMEDILLLGSMKKMDEEAEKPVSFLACCLEWHDYTEAKNHQRLYMSHLPIPVDGSNNGWQHLGAISKDVQTGELVGLVPVDIQADFYVQTAKELINLTTDKRRSAILESMPMKHIRKGISKRGSMTRAYSAGARKIAENMWLDCRSEGYHDLYGIEEEDCFGFAADLIKAIDAVCPGPLKTMEYLQNLAQFEIGRHGKFLDDERADSAYTKLRKQVKELWETYDKSDEQKQEIDNLLAELSNYETRLVYGNGAKILTWETPSGFPVTYEATVMRAMETKGTIANYTKYNKAGRVQHKGQEPTETPDIQKYICGISPNYIHSLDASHMALIIADWTGDFGAVHDSFSTHACDVEDLVTATKQQFVEMYNHENYFDSIRLQLTGSTDDVQQPDLGELDVNEVYNSDYFFA